MIWLSNRLQVAVHLLYPTDAVRCDHRKESAACNVMNHWCRSKGEFSKGDVLHVL